MKKKVRLPAHADLALGPDSTVLGLHDALRDGEAETRSEPSGPLGLPEPVEDPRQVLLRNAGSGVGHEEPHLGAARLYPERDRAALGGELDRVADDVREDLQHPAPVACHVQVGAADRLQAQALLGRRGVERFHGITHDEFDGEQARLDREATALDGRRVQEVVDEPIHPQRRAPDGVDGLAGVVPRRAGAQSEGRAHQDHTERVPQIVRDDREQLFPLSNGTLGQLVQPRVVHRHRGPPRDLLGEDEVVRAVAPARIGGDESERADDAAAGAERHDDEGLRSDPANEAQMLLSVREVFRRDLAHVLDQDGDHPSTRTLALRRRSARIGRVPLRLIAELGVPVDVGEDGFDALAATVLVDQIDETSVGEERNGQLRDRRDDLADVEGPRQTVTEVGEEPEAVLELGQRRDVDDGRAVPRHAAACVSKRDAHELRHHGAAPLDRESHFARDAAVAEAAPLKVGSKRLAVFRPDERTERHVDQALTRRSKEGRTRQVDVLNAASRIERAVPDGREVVEVAIPASRTLDDGLRSP